MQGVSMPPWDRLGKIVPYARTTCLQDDTPVGGVLGGGDMHSKKRTSVGWRVGFDLKMANPRRVNFKASVFYYNIHVSEKKCK